MSRIIRHSSSLALLLAVSAVLLQTAMALTEGSYPGYGTGSYGGYYGGYGGPSANRTVGDLNTTLANRLNSNGAASVSGLPAALVALVAAAFAVLQMFV